MTWEVMSTSQEYEVLQRNYQTPEDLRGRDRIKPLVLQYMKINIAIVDDSVRRTVRSVPQVTYIDCDVKRLMSNRMDVLG